MRALFKTLFGDRANLAVVAVVLALEGLLVHTGHARDAAFAVPVVTLAGISWLAMR
ncbi:MAG: hypothetical protein M0037_08960 [Betaproteobacteria bacterium]|nr:hypothetical protein [Betaproteobacteria bacterium]